MKVNESIELSESDAIAGSAQNSDNKMHRIEER